MLPEQKVESKDLMKGGGERFGSQDLLALIDVTVTHRQTQIHTDARTQTHRLLW